MTMVHHICLMCVELRIWKAIRESVHEAHVWMLLQTWHPLARAATHGYVLQLLKAT